MIRIEVGRRNYLLYLLLPHPLKVRLLSPASLATLDRVNQMANVRSYSANGAVCYDRIHGYGGPEQHEYPTRLLVTEAWAQRGYGRALEVGAGTGYFTELIARRAHSVLAVELVPDMQEVIRTRCRSEGLDNVEVVGTSVFSLGARVAEQSVDSAFMLHSLHHLHRRDEVFHMLGRVVRPGGRLFLAEPHHNIRRACSLLRRYVTSQRSRAFWTDETNWATHDFLARGEIRRLCRHGGFEDVHISGHWIPFARRLVPDARRRFRLERRLGRLPGLRHAAGVLAVEARRSSRPSS